MKKSLAVIGVLSILLVSISVTAIYQNGKISENGRLGITSIESSVDGNTDRNLEYGDFIQKDLKPGSELMLTIFLKNLNIPDQQRHIDDVVLTITLSDEEGTTLLAEERGPFTVQSGEFRRESITFNIPLIVETGTYDVAIVATGSDDKREHSVEYALQTDIVKKSRDVTVVGVRNNDPTTSCGQTISISGKIINTGTTPQDITFRAINDAIGLDKSETAILESGTNSEAVTADLLITHTISEETPPGQYAIGTTVSYNGGESSHPQTVWVRIEECVSSETVSEPEVIEVPNTPEEVRETEQVVVEETEIVVDAPPENQIVEPDQIVQPPVTTGPQENKVLVVIGALVVILLLLLLISHLVSARS